MSFLDNESKHISHSIWSSQSKQISYLKEFTKYSPISNDFTNSRQFPIQRNNSKKSKFFNFTSSFHYLFSNQERFLKDKTKTQNNEIDNSMFYCHLKI